MKAAAPLTILAAGLVSISLASCAPDASRGRVDGSPAVVAEAIAVLSEQRWVEPRLSISGTYGPCFADCEPGRLLCEPRCTVGAGLDFIRHNPPPPVSLGLETASEGSAEKHAEALLALVGSGRRGGHRHETSERAVQMLEELTEQHPYSARIRSDLAAAQLVWAQRRDRPADLLLALETVEGAVRLAPRLPAARFNQALVHEALALRQTAMRAWRLYLNLDPESGWAGEARRRLNALHYAEDPPREFASQHAIHWAIERRDFAALRRAIEPLRATARLHVAEELLPAWAAAIDAGDAERAHRQLETARQVAGVLSELGGDTQLFDAVAAIAGSTPEQRRSLAAGHRAYGAATRSLADFELPTAVARFEKADRELKKAASPLQPWAEIGLAVCSYQNGAYEDALRRLAPMRCRPARDECRRSGNLRGRTAWLAALSLSVLTRPLEALAAYQESIAWFTATGEQESLTRVHARLADLYHSMGADTPAWHHRYLALRGLPGLQHPRQKFFVSIEAGRATLDLDLPTSGLLLLDEALRVAHQADNGLFQAIALRLRAEGHLRANDSAAALSDLRQAARLSLAFPDPGVHQPVEARILEVEGRVWQASDPLQAASRFGEALALLPSDAFRGYRAKLLLERARAFRAANQAEKAEVDLSASLRTLEEEWTHVLKKRRRGEYEPLWTPYFDHRQETFDLMIALLAEQGRADLALSYSERARARELLDLITDRSSSTAFENSLHPLSAEAIRERLPEGRVLVEFAQLDNRLLLWEIRRGRSRLHVVETGRAEFEKLAGKIRRAFAGRDATVDVHGVLERLYSLLVGPFIARLEADEELIFVLDGPLHGLPLAALRDPETGRFLVQDHVLSVAPSATLYLFALRRDRELAQDAAPSVLLVGNPAFDRQLFRDLEDLPEALAETDRIAESYLGAVVLEGTEATKPRFLKELGRHAIVHFAGHAIPHPRDPFRSSLLLAPSAEDPGVLYAHELLRHDLGRTRLVVFSACSTAGGHPIGSLSVAGLVRPVLGAGVPAVVGTLWDVRSSAAARLLSIFHRRLSAGEDAASALRRAQLEMLDGNLAERSIESWAPFQLIGVATFNHSRERSLP